MKSREIILASKSSRRKELLEESGIKFQIHTEAVEEVLHLEQGVRLAVEQIALDKAKAVASKYPEAIVIGADTMVCLDDELLGKPIDEEDARAMLHRLSGNTHEVITGVALCLDDRCVIFHEVTKVTFYDLEETIIDAYIASKEPFDKAGAYGIQGKGRLFVKGIEGDFFNVVGLPIARVYREIKKLQKL